MTILIKATLIASLVILSACGSDTDSNKEVLATPNQVITHTYNANGHIVRSEYADVDGNMEIIETLTRDDHDNIIHFETDYGADGTADSIATDTYDANNNWLISKSDENGDGVINYSTINIYDASNNLISRTDYTGDGETDGAASRIVTHTYDDNNNKTMTELDSNANGYLNNTYIFTYNDANQVITETNGHGGTITNTYNLDGYKTGVAYDDDSNGSTDRTYVYEYNDRAQITLGNYDGDANGSIDTIEINTYDSKGMQTRFEYDNNADGTPERVHTYIYTYDANGNITYYEKNEGDAETLVKQESTKTYYDNLDQIVRTEDDSDGDGVMDFIITFIHVHPDSQ